MKIFYLKIKQKSEKGLLEFCFNFYFSKTQKFLCKKGPGLVISVGLLRRHHSQARSHYRPTRGLLAAGFPPWPGSPLLGQPGGAGLPLRPHIDAGLSADARSTWRTPHQDSQPQTIHRTRPPSSWITGGAKLPVIHFVFVSDISVTKKMYCHTFMYYWKR